MDVRQVVGGAIAGILLGASAALGLVSEEEKLIPVTPVDPSHPGCHSGWTPDTPAGEDHQIVYKCLRENWHVVIFEDGSCSHGWEATVPSKFYECSEIPQW